MTDRENYIRMLKGEEPAFLPRFDIFGWGCQCSLLTGERGADGSGKDAYGVEYVATKETNNGAMPVPGKFILDDIRKWRDVIKTPDITNVDWEALAKKDIKNRDFVNNPKMMTPMRGLFQQLMAFMGFTEGLCALSEEPEECMELFDHMCNFGLELGKKIIKYYKPDIIGVGDDNATALNPFISPKMYREMFKPYVKKVCDLALENNLVLNMHDCGRCEDFIDDWIEMGITGWDPAQIMNDLLGIKKKYAGKLVLAGCWDSSGPVSWLTTDDQVLKDGLAEYVDTYAPGGGFAFTATIMSPPDDPDGLRKKAIVTDFYNDYARNWYKTHS